VVAALRSRSPSTRQCLVIALLVAVLFAAHASIRLEGQGAFYDELHAAPMAFSHVGSEPAFFDAMSLRGIPWMNLSYIAAIKSNLYGLYMKFTGSRFSLHSWRLLGISFVVLGLFGFCWASGSSFSWSGLTAFLLLFLSDVTVLLTTRHDWAPTALALALRLSLIAVWLNGRTLVRGSAFWHAFLLGAIVGFSVYEKLSSVVLVVFVYLVLLFDSRFRTRRAWAAVHLGVIVGAVPLLIANIVSAVSTRTLISLAPAFPGRPGASLADHLFGYFELGQGRWVREWILDASPAIGWSAVEVLLLLVASGWVASLAMRHTETPGLARAEVALATFGGIAVAFYMLPEATLPHHWIAGTPFQYAAIGLALTALGRAAPSGKARQSHLALMLVVAALVVVRVPAVATTGAALWQQQHSARFDPAFTRLGNFVAQHPDSLFVAATWGVATQMYCWSQGDDQRIWEPMWDDVQLQRFREKMIAGGWQSLYIVLWPSYDGINPEGTAKTIRAVEESSAWQETESEPEINESSFVVRKFVPSSPPDAPSHDEAAILRVPKNLGGQT
jgi:hypothetical protein